MTYNDVDLIQQTLDGDQQAFTELVKKYQKQVHALAWQKIGDFHIAQEITQDTFLTAYHKLTTLKDPKCFAGWLYVIANRKCIAWHRKKKTQPQSLEAMDPVALEEVYCSVYMTQQREEAANQKRREVVQKLLSKLQESERTVVNLYYIAEMTCEDIGKFLGVSPNTVRSRLHRARNRLRKEETMIKENLSSFQLPTQLTESIMKEISHIKPAAPSSSKPLLPWAIAASTLAVVLLTLGFGNHQYLTRFQKPYSFDATTEMTVDIIDAPIVANLETKPDVRTQIESTNAIGKHNNPEQQPNRASTEISEAQGDEIVKDYTQWELPEKAKARFGKGGINVIQFSPDGRQLAVGSSIGVWLYDVETEKELSMFPGKCKFITFSPDGSFLASIVSGQVTQLWEVATGQKVIFNDDLPKASILRFSEDGKTLFALSQKGDSISQLDVITGKMNVKHIGGRTGWNYRDVFAITHDKFAVGTENKTELWDTTTREILSTLEGNRRVLDLKFSPDGKQLASAGEVGYKTVKLQLWDAESKESTTLEKHTGWVHALAFSPDGKILASGGSDMTVQLWDITTGEPLTTFTGHNSGINALTFSPDNRTLASGSADGTVQFWNVKTKNSLPTRITEHTTRVEAATFFKDNTTLATVAHDGIVSLWDVETSQRIDTSTLRKTDFYHKGDQNREFQVWLTTSAFSPDGTKIVSAGAKGNSLPDSSRTEYTQDRLIRLSDVKSGHELQTLTTDDGPACLTFSPDGNTVAFGDSGQIRLWDTETGETLDIALAMLSADTSHFDQDEIDKIPDHIKTQINELEPTISTLVFSPDGKKLVSATLGGKVEMWDAKTGASLARLFEGKGPITEGTPPDISIAYQTYIESLAFSPNGNLIAMASTEKVHVLTLQNHTLLREISNSASPQVLVFSPDKAMLVIGLHGGRIELWDLKTEDRPIILKGHTETVQTLVFSLDGKTLVSTGNDGTILLWDWDEVLKDANREKNK